LIASQKFSYLILSSTAISFYGKLVWAASKLCGCSVVFNVRVLLSLTYL
jgi:hypothetical protein